MDKETRIIGVDESGKGDFFGPLVVAAFLASDRELDDFKELNIRDSKKITDKRILEMDQILRKNFDHAVFVVTPEKYNIWYDEIRNLNKLLAEGHAEVIAQLYNKSGADLTISDKFGKLELVETAVRKRDIPIKVTALVRGERIGQVAAASIMARAEFVREMDRLSAEIGMKVPKGAGPIVDKLGREIVAEHGPEILPKLAKLHFKNYHRVMKISLFK